MNLTEWLTEHFIIMTLVGCGFLGLMVIGTCLFVFFSNLIGRINYLFKRTHR